MKTRDWIEANEADWEAMMRGFEEETNAVKRFNPGDMMYTLRYRQFIEDHIDNYRYHMDLIMRHCQGDHGVEGYADVKVHETPFYSSHYPSTDRDINCGIRICTMDNIVTVFGFADELEQIDLLLACGMGEMGGAMLAVDASNLHLSGEKVDTWPDDLMQAFLQVVSDDDVLNNHGCGATVRYANYSIEQERGKTFQRFDYVIDWPNEERECRSARSEIESA